MSKSFVISLSLAAVIAGAALAASAQTPQGAQQTAPAEPIDHADWSKDENWLCLPGRQDACAIPLDTSIVAPNGSIRIERFKPNPKAAIDCFYVYPTVSLDNFSQSDLVPGPEERAVISRQFARLASVCRTFAPMYRQTTLPQLRAGQGSGPQPPRRGAAGQGNVDVDEAFDHYMQHHNNGRGFVLIGHSQGAGQISRLIRAKVEGKPIQKQMVSALIIGSGVTVAPGSDVGGTFQTIPACRSKDQIGCVVAYGSFRDTVPPPPTGQAVGAGSYGEGRQTEGLCVNPAALAGGKATPKSYWAVEPPINPSTKAPPRWSHREIIRTPFAATPGLITTECVRKNGRIYLEVHVDADPNDQRADDVYGDVLTADGGANASWGLHNLDMNIGMGDFIDLLKAQGRAYQRANR